MNCIFLFLQSCDYEIQALRLQPIQQEQTVPVPSPVRSSSSSGSSTEKIQPNLLIATKSVNTILSSIRKLILSIF